MYEKAVNRKSHVHFSPRQTLDFLTSALANGELTYDIKRRIVKQYLDVRDHSHASFFLKVSLVVLCRIKEIMEFWKIGFEICLLPEFPQLKRNWARWGLFLSFIKGLCSKAGFANWQLWPPKFSKPSQFFSCFIVGHKTVKTPGNQLQVILIYEICSQVFPRIIDMWSYKM